MKKLAIALVCILLVVGVVGGTLAWLTDTTPAVTNTFTTSGIDITLEETPNDLDDDDDNNTNSYQMIPGHTIIKDPKVTVLADSEDCYLFVKVEKSANFDTFMEYEMAAGWKPVPGETNVYYYDGKVAASDENQEFPVILNNTVTVKSDVTKKDMDDLTADDYPTLTVTAYATQYYETNNDPFDVADAWAAVNS